MPNRLLDRYILKELIDYFLFGLVIFSLIAFFSDTLLDFLQDVYIPLGTLLTMIGLQLPKTLALVLPASTFLAVLMTYNQMNNHFEIISMRVNGISLNRLVVPALILGLASTLVTYYLYDFVVPYCNQQTELLKEDALSKGSLPFGRKSFMFPSYDDHHNLKRMIYVSSYNGHQLGDSTVIDLSNPGMMQVIQAKSGAWDENTGWTFNGPNTYVVAQKAESSASSHSDQINIHQLVQSQDAQKQIEAQQRQGEGTYVDSDTQTFWQMYAGIQRALSTGHRVARKTYLNMWERWTLPLSCIVMLLSGVALAITPPRSGNSRGFIFALGILFFYYILRSCSVSLSHAGAFTLGGLIHSPWDLFLGAWLPIFLMAILGVVLLARKSQVL